MLYMYVCMKGLMFPWQVTVQMAAMLNSAKLSTASQLSFEEQADREHKLPGVTGIPVTFQS